MTTHTVEFYKDRKKQHRWRMVANNGEIVATGAGDGYKRKATM